MTSLAGVARGVLGLGLTILFVIGLRDGMGYEEPLSLSSGTPVETLAGSLALRSGDSASRAGAIVYIDSLPPSRSVAALLAGAAEGGQFVTLTVPGTLPALSVRPPTTLVAMRRSSLEVTLRRAANTALPAVIENPSGTSDTLTIEAGPSGISSVAVAIEPTRSGQGEWTVVAGGHSATVHAWTRPEAPVRVLVVSGPPSWESRFLVRALESSGALVSVHQSLGRDQEISTEGVRLPTTVSEFDDYDVVALVGTKGDVPEGTLRRWVEESGGGLLLVGVSETGEFGAWSPRGATPAVSTDRLRWSGPVELIPLPSAAIAPKATALAQPVAGTPVTWTGTREDTPDRVFSAASWVGRGRVFTTGLQTWFWVMEAGLEVDHGTHWESVVEWLAGGLRDDVSLTGSIAEPYVAWEGRFGGLSRAESEGVELTRPDVDGSPPRVASVEKLDVSRSRTSAARVRFVPLAAGGHGLKTEAGPGLGAVVTASGEPHSWTQAALDIGGGGGEVVAYRESRSFDGRPMDASTRLRWLGFLLLATAALAGWTVRRVNGLA